MATRKKTAVKAVAKKTKLDRLVAKIGHIANKALGNEIHDYRETAVHDLINELENNTPEMAHKIISSLSDPVLQAEARDYLQEHQVEFFELMQDTGLYFEEWAEDGEIESPCIYGVRGSAFIIRLVTPHGGRGAGQSVTDFLTDKEVARIEALIPIHFSMLVLRVEDLRLQRALIPLPDIQHLEWRMNGYMGMKSDARVDQGNLQNSFLKCVPLASMMVRFAVMEGGFAKALHSLMLEEQEVLEENIVFRFSDDWYVVELTAGQLRKEGQVLRHCVGYANMGYKEAVRAGTTRMFSIRMPDGKPKFTVEYSKPFGKRSKGWEVAQIKGKVNRLPGFASKHADPKDTLKVDEVLRCAEFVQTFLDYSDDELLNITDLEPGLLAIGEWQTQLRKPTKNPGRRGIALPARIPISAKVARLANQVQANDPARWEEDEY